MADDDRVPPVTTPHPPAAPLGVERTAPDLAAIEARAAAASRIDRYALPAEVLASLADNATLLAALRSLRAHVASEPERVAAAVAAEHAIALLSRTLGCESDTPEGIVTEALDYAAEQRERAEAADDAVARADAADARLAALASAVRAYLDAEDGYDPGCPGGCGVVECCTREAVDAARTVLDAALAAATTTPKESR